MNDNDASRDRIGLAPEPTLQDYSSIAFDLREIMGAEVQAAMEAVDRGGDDSVWKELQNEILATDMSMRHAKDRFEEQVLPMATDAVEKLTPVERALLWVNYRIPEALADLHEFDAGERLAASVCDDVLEKLWLESSYGSDR